MSRYISLHNHTIFSIMNSIIKPSDLFKRAAELEMPAVGITDNFTMAGIYDSYKAYKSTKVKLIAGCQFNFVDTTKPYLDYNQDNKLSKPKEKLKNIVLIAKNDIGYKNILLLNRKSFDCKFGKMPLIDWNNLQEYSEGVICLTGDACGILGTNISSGNIDKARQDASKLKEIFSDNLGLEFVPNNLKYNECDQFATNRNLLKISQDLSIKPVAASNAMYLYKEQHKVHDLLLAIKNGRSLSDSSRPRFEFEQLYLHTDQEIIKFFSRNFGEEFANILCDNSLYFAGMCEKPNWVKPEVVTGDKAQLPTFPIKDSDDYDQFNNWLPNIDDNIKNLDTDQLYMRFKCEKNWAKYVPQDKNDIYKKRLSDELSVFESLGFSSYMLITADFIEWARNNNIPVGPGRGCLTKDTLVLTENGFKNLDEINIGDKVYSHSGKIQNVINKFEFNIEDEKLLKLKIENSFGDIVLTKDHKIYGCKKIIEKVEKDYNYGNKIIHEKHDKIKFTDPTWIKAKDLNIGDYIYSAFPERNAYKYDYIFDLANFCNEKDVVGDKIIIRNKIVNEFSIRDVSRKTNISFEIVRKIKNNIIVNKKYVEEVTAYLLSNNLSLDNWINIPKYNITYINRFIPLDNDFLYLLGLWIGDGCIRYKQKNGINYSFNINEEDSINAVYSFYNKLGFNLTKRTNGVNGCCFDIGTTILSNLFKHIFPFYKNESKTKHLPSFFRKLNDDQLLCLVKGIIDSDGHVDGNNESIKTISYQLAKELKEVFNKLHIVCGILVSKAETLHGRNNSKCYQVRFSGINTPLKIKSIFGNGYYSKIIDIKECNDNKVYDITVENDNSYLTSSGVVHNSVGGSLIGYLLGIHRADPIKYGLIFERFLNMEKKAYPDIDNDFDSEGREKVLDYVTNKYGKDYVAHVSNFITFTPKVAITDIITSLEIGGSRKDAFRIAKNITETIDAGSKNLKDAINSSKLLAEFVKEHPEIIEYGEPLLGTIRSWATHAAGVVIGKYELPGLVPLRLDDSGVVVLEWEKERTEENGLVKIDFLGLETLNIIKTTNQIIYDINSIEAPKEIDFDLEYKEVYDLITNGKTLGVFQLGASGGTIGLCNMTEPKNIEDIAVINALTRPGVPNDIKMSYIDRKFGREKVVIPHSNLERAVKATLGYCIFEESFMFLAHDFCGWDLQKSDKMRKISKLKAKGKQILKELEEEFGTSAVNHSHVKPEFAKKIWDEWVIPLSGYAFNKSHSLLYSMTSLHTAYLKAYYNNEFLTANLISESKSNSPTAKDNILKIRHELRKCGVKIYSPDINKSYDTYRLINKNSLITGISSLHGIKSPPAENIMLNRPFSSFEDFLIRTDSSKVRSPVIQALAACGALDSFNLPRKTMYLYCSDLRSKYKAWNIKNPGKKFEYTLPKDEWNIGEMRAMEVHYLGEAFSGTKQDSFPKLFSGHNAVSSIKDLTSKPEKTQVVIEGEVIDMFTFKVKKQDSKIFGQECCKILIEDLSGHQISMVFFPDSFRKFQHLFDDTLGNSKFEKGFGIRVSGQTSKFGNETSIIGSDIYGLFAPIDKPSDLDPKKIELSITRNKKVKEITNEDIIDELSLIISSN
ncbi:MAG: PHP domain-containing protein [Bacteroidia bacterium]